MTNGYKLMSLALMATFAMIAIPSSFDTTEDLAFYGMATITQSDANGNELFEQTVHNLLTDQGEDYIIDQAFATADTAAANRIGAICITNVSTGLGEIATAATMGANSLGTTAHCLVDTDVEDDTTSTAVIGPLQFTGGTNLATGETITSIAICSANGGTAYDNCDDGSPAVAFAVVDTSDVTLNTGDTVNITYTFDIISDGN